MTNHPNRKQPTIIVTVSGGVVQGVAIPKGCNVKVTVRDFDQDGTPDDELDGFEETTYQTPEGPYVQRKGYTDCVYKA